MPGTETASPLLIYMIKQVELAVRARLDEIVRPAGLTALQYTALSVLERHTDMSSAQLARSSFVTAQSMAAVGARIAQHAQEKGAENINPMIAAMMGLDKKEQAAE